jgi:hypothetical protein
MNGVLYQGERMNDEFLELENASGLNWELVLIFYFG